MQRLLHVVAPLLEAARLVPHGAVPRRLLQQELEDAPRRVRLPRARLEQRALEERAPRLVDRHRVELAQQRARHTELAHALKVLDALEHERLVVRAVVQPRGEDALAAIEVAALLLHLCVLEPRLRRARLQLRREAVEATRLRKVLLSLGEVGHLEMDAPVHRFRKLAHAALRKVARETLAFELRVLTPQRVRKVLVHRSRLWAHSELLALPKVLADNVVGARGVGGFARLQRAARRVRGQRAVRRMQRVRRVRAMRRVRHVERARGLHHPIGLLHPAARRLALALQRAAHGSIAAVKKR
mmetsp:Transcript_3717/g.7724  ORF Transcript_3717/g.7724 Transcript_3717/m.7724 type:complete len:300 (-) Transcript_3717:200-1099(-)